DARHKGGSPQRPKHWIPQRTPGGGRLLVSHGLEPVRHTALRVVNVVGGSSVLEKGSGEEVSIVYGQRQMPVDAPLHLNFGLVSYESSLARSSRAQEDQRAVVDSVVAARAPENVPVARQYQISG